MLTIATTLQKTRNQHSIPQCQYHNQYYVIPDHTTNNTSYHFKQKYHTRPHTPHQTRPHITSIVPELHTLRYTRPYVMRVIPDQPHTGGGSLHPIATSCLEYPIGWTARIFFAVFFWLLVLVDHWLVKVPSGPREAGAGMGKAPLSPPPPGSSVLSSFSYMLPS